MGKLHKIRRLLKKPEERTKISNFRMGTWGGRRTELSVGWWSNAHASYVKKILREYSGL